MKLGKIWLVPLLLGVTAESKRESHVEPPWVIVEASSKTNWAKELPRICFAVQFGANRALTRTCLNDEVSFSGCCRFVWRCPTQRLMAKTGVAKPNAHTPFEFPATLPPKLSVSDGSPTPALRSSPGGLCASLCRSPPAPQQPREAVRGRRLLQSCYGLVGLPQSRGARQTRELLDFLPPAMQ